MPQWIRHIDGSRRSRHFATTRILRGFTIIELLVVVTVIVVLLTLLTPAMDRAMYETEMAACGANMRGMGAGLLTYAGSNQRTYPHRPTTQLNGAPSNAETSSIVWGGPTRDDRIPLRDYFSIKMLVDPINKFVDLDHPAQSTYYIYSSYSLWWNWQWYNGTLRGRFIRKIGDRFGLPGEDAKFDLLASDFNRTVIGSSYAGAHPDNAQRAYPWYFEEDPSGAVVYSFSLWAAADASQRGTLDCNYLYQDGSVNRLDDLTIDPLTDLPDERLESVPERTDMANSVNTPYTESIPAK